MWTDCCCVARFVGFKCSLKEVFLPQLIWAICLRRSREAGWTTVAVKENRQLTIVDERLSQSGQSAYGGRGKQAGRL